MSGKNDGVLFEQKGMSVEAIDTKEREKGDTRKVVLTELGITVTIEAPAEDLEDFRRKQDIDVTFYKRQRELPT